jgi:hypothetical protein
MSKVTPTSVPEALRKWFILHFWADILFAIPLFIAPNIMLGALGWKHIDPYTARLTAAALFGIGIESWLGRHARSETFCAMLNMKIIWSGTACIGIGISLLEAPHARPMFAWVTLAIFILFHALWVYWRIRLQRLSA